MLEAPRHDWALCEKRSHVEHVEWLRRLTPDDVLDLCEDFHDLVATQPGRDRGLERISEDHWAEKVTLRKRLHAAFAALDQVRRSATP